MKDYPLVVNAIDTDDDTIHGLELDDPERTVFSVLWHPEACGRYEGSGMVDTDLNIKIVKYLRDKAAQYRKTRLARK